jgi:hypothetical protein
VISEGYINFAGFARVLSRLGQNGCGKIKRERKKKW